MGAKINAVKEFLGLGTKKVTNVIKEQASKEVKTVSDEAVQNLQTAQAAYGKANLAIKAAAEKKQYVLPDGTKIEIDPEKVNKMKAYKGAASGIHSSGDGQHSGENDGWSDTGGSGGSPIFGESPLQQGLWDGM